MDITDLKRGGELDRENQIGSVQTSVSLDQAQTRQTQAQTSMKF